MKAAVDGPKKAFLSIIVDQKHKLEEALIFYEQLETSIPSEQQWKVLKPSPFEELLGGVIPPDTCLPSGLVETAITTMDEYLEAIERFSPDQFAAFLMGLGARWIPVAYWGIPGLNSYYEKLLRASAYYDKLEAKVPEDEQWKIRRQNPFDGFNELVPPDSLLPSEVLARARSVTKGMLNALGDRPF